MFEYVNMVLVIVEDRGSRRVVIFMEKSSLREDNIYERN